MTKKLETKNSLVWGKRGSFYFGQILMTLKKSFAPPCIFFPKQLNLKNRTAQHLLEYLLVIALVAAACIAMRTYVFRAAQATHQAIQEEFSKF